jgi:hypothetical protein
VAKLSGMSTELEPIAASAKTAADASRLHALEAILKHPAA